MSDNSTFGVQNISEVNNSVNSSTLSPGEIASRSGDVFSQYLAGSWELSGVFLLLVMGGGLYKVGVDMDNAVALMSPAVFFLVREGMLPGSQGLGVAAILAVSALFISGLIRFFR